MKKLRVLDLFSGIGGFSLGLERTGGFETVAFCEIEEFPRKVLAKHWPEVPCFEDVRTLKGSDVGAIDVICGGYPCQPFSTAGKRRGQKDDRHLWPEFNRLVAELRPTWVIGENVAGHISMGLDDVLSDLEGQGYTCRTFVIPACAVAAHHRRDRCWTIAHSEKLQCNVSAQHSEQSERQVSELGERGGAFALADAKGKCSDGRKNGKPSGQGIQSEARASGSTVSNATCERGRSRHAQRQDAKDVWQSPSGQGNDRSRVGAWLPEPGLGRVAHGISNRVVRLKALGNAVVPQIPEMIGHAILEAEGV